FPAKIATTPSTSACACSPNGTLYWKQRATPFAPIRTRWLCCDIPLIPFDIWCRSLWHRHRERPSGRAGPELGLTLPRMTTAGARAPAVVVDVGLVLRDLRVQ